MTIGIIGSGAIGAAFARRLTQANIPAILSNSRGPKSLADLVSNIGGPSGPGRERKRLRRTWCWWRSTGQSCQRRSAVCQVLAGGL